MSKDLQILKPINCEYCEEKVERGIVNYLNHLDVCLKNKTEDADFEVIHDEPEAPTLSRNIEDEAGLWEDKNKEEMQKVNKDMMELGMSCYKKDKDGNVTRINPLSDEANDAWNKKQNSLTNPEQPSASGVI